MIYFEDARLEFFGKPVVYLPYFSAPDPTVKRKTGLLIPRHQLAARSTAIGVDIPYFWALAPDYDLTFTPRLMTKQGLLLQGEWRQRLMNGAYSIRAAGIYQLDKDAFLRDAGPPDAGLSRLPRQHRNHRPVRAERQVDLGLGRHPADRPDASSRTIDLSHLSARRQHPFKPGLTEGVSQLYLTGRGDRSYFDARAIYYYGFSEADVQSQIPVIHPVVDYSYIFGNPVFGGELGYRANLTSLSREQRRFRSDHARRRSTPSLCALTTADPALKTPANCLLRGFPGTYTRASAEANWRRSITDPSGRYGRRSPICAPTPAARRSTTRSGVSNYLTARRQPRSSASCRRSASNTAIRSSACSPGARRPSSRSRS